MAARRAGVIVGGRALDVSSRGAELCTMTARRRVSLWFRFQQQGRRCHRWRFLVPVIVGGRALDGWHAGRSIVGGSWFLSSLAAVRISSRGGGPRPREGGGGIRRATGPPGGGESRCSVAAVSLEIERLQVLVLKEEYLKANELRRQAGPCFLNKIVRMQQICRKYSQKAGSNAAF